MRSKPTTAEIVTMTGELARQAAELAKLAIGPDGVVMRCPEDDAQLMRATFMARLAETGTKLANGEPLV